MWHNGTSEGTRAVYIAEKEGERATTMRRAGGVVLMVVLVVLVLLLVGWMRRRTPKGADGDDGGGGWTVSTSVWTIADADPYRVHGADASSNE